MLNDEFDVSISYGPPRHEGHTVTSLGQETVTPLCTPQIAKSLREIADLAKHDLIDSQNSRVRWEMWFTSNNLRFSPSPAMQFDRSHLSIAAASDGLGIALESTRLAERELATGRLVAPMMGRSTSVTYTGHFLIVPEIAARRKPVVLFTEWLQQEATSAPDLPKQKRR